MFGMFKRKKRDVGVRYIHPTQIKEVTNSIDCIVHHLNAAIVMAEKMRVNSCETEKFKMYKKVFHETWLGVAECYNAINNIDVEKCSDRRYIS